MKVYIVSHHLPTVSLNHGAFSSREKAFIYIGRQLEEHRECVFDYDHDSETNIWSIFTSKGTWTIEPMPLDNIG